MNFEASKAVSIRVLSVAFPGKIAARDEFLNVMGRFSNRSTSCIARCIAFAFSAS